MKKIIRSLEKESTKIHLSIIIFLLFLIELAIPSWRIGIGVLFLILTVPFMYSVNYSIGKLRNSEKNPDFYVKYFFSRLTYSLIFVLSLRYLLICIFGYYFGKEIIPDNDKALTKEIIKNAFWGILLWMLLVFILRYTGRNKTKKEHL